MSNPDLPPGTTDAPNRLQSEGTRDLRRRVRLLAPIEPADEQVVIKVVTESASVGWIDRLVTRTGRAWDSSLIVGTLRHAWSRLTLADRRRLIGLTLLVAAAVHVSLVVWHERPPQWHWLILPVFGSAVGLLFLVFAGSKPTERS